MWRHQLQHIFLFNWTIWYCAVTVQCRDIKPVKLYFGEPVGTIKTQNNNKNITVYYNLTVQKEIYLSIYRWSKKNLSARLLIDLLTNHDKLTHPAAKKALCMTWSRDQLSVNTKTFHFSKTLLAKAERAY